MILMKMKVITTINEISIIKDKIKRHGRVYMCNHSQGKLYKLYSYDNYHPSPCQPLHHLPKREKRTSINIDSWRQKRREKTTTRQSLKEIMKRDIQLLHRYKSDYKTSNYRIPIQYFRIY